MSTNWVVRYGGWRSPARTYAEAVTVAARINELRRSGKISRAGKSAKVERVDYPFVYSADEKGRAIL